MTSSKSTSLLLFVALNFLFFNLAAAACRGCPPSPGPPPPPPGGTPSPPPPPPPPPPGGTPSPPSGGTPPPPPPPSGGTCPRDALTIGACANVLNTLLNITIGTPPVQPCCTLIQGLADLEAAICLCTAIKASILGININLPIALSLLLNVCSRTAPAGFMCS